MDSSGLTAGLLLTGHAILTPMLMVIVMIGGDFLAMSATTDRVRPSTAPNQWRIGRVMLTASVLGGCNLLFCVAVLAAGQSHLGLTTGHGLRTLAAVALVCSSQASFYVVRERRHLWSSRPSAWVVISSVADVAVIALLAERGLLMHALPACIIAAVLAAAVLFAFVLDAVKALLYTRLRLT